MLHYPSTFAKGAHFMTGGASKVLKLCVRNKIDF